MARILEQGLWFLSLAALSLAECCGENTPFYQFTEIPAGNKSHVVDLDAEPQTEVLERRTDVNRYLLYTRENSESPQRLRLNDEESVLNSTFNPNVPTALLVHGWQSQPSFGLDSLVSRALLQKRSYNVIILDWRRLSSFDYVTSVAAVPSVGRHAGQFLEFLHSLTGAPYESMHLIGHSLGAHVVGNAGRELGGKAARITGLDPAGPLWSANPNRLRSSDAVYVEAIHTNSGTFGIIQNVADVDFFPNGGALQPGCFSTVCNHGRSYELFAASINDNNLVGRKCSNFLQMTLDLCRGSELPLGNDDLQKSGSGIYRLNTGRKYPY